MSEYHNLNGICLHRLKYKDNALIIKVFTLEQGMTTMILRGIRSKKSSKYYMTAPFSLLEIECRFKENKDIQLVREIKLRQPLASIQANIGKSAVVLFMTEVLYKTMEDGYKNQPLYRFLYNAVVKLDEIGNYSNFHLWFLIRLSEYYGFYPDSSNFKEGSIFSLSEGRFESQVGRERGDFLDAKQSFALYTILGMEFAGVMSLKMTATERADLLSGMVDYFRFHTESLKGINSLVVLKAVFK